MRRALAVADEVAGVVPAGGKVFHAGLSLRLLRFAMAARDRPGAGGGEHVAVAVETIGWRAGEAPLGWYTGRDSPNTRRLVVEHGGFLYDSDSYADDLPYWAEVAGRGPHLVVPYALDTNDMRFAAPGGFPSGEQFFAHLRDAFDCLYAEGEAGAPKMLSIGLHCRLVGRPARLPALARFLDHALARPGVWVARRVDIARHWAATHPPLTLQSRADAG